MHKETYFMQDGTAFKEFSSASMVHPRIFGSQYKLEYFSEGL